MFTVSDYQRSEIGRLGGEYSLKLLLLYGSFARDTARPQSDIDIAVLGKNEISLDTLIDI